MDLVISIIVFIIVFIVIYDVLSLINKKWIKMRPLISMKSNFKNGLLFIGLLIIMFISFELINFTNPLIEGLFMGVALALMVNFTNILIEHK